MVSTAGDDERTFGPSLLDGVAVGSREIEELWFYDSEAPDGAGVATKDMGAPAIVQVPYPHGTISGAGDEGVVKGGESPNATFVALERTKEITGKGRVDVDGLIVRGGDDTIMGEEETGDDGGTVSGKADVFWGVIVGPTDTGEMAGLEEEFVGVRKGERKGERGTSVDGTSKGEF